jgi:hypothetical protein
MDSSRVWEPVLSKIREKASGESFSLWEKDGPAAPDEGARPTIRAFCKIMGRAALTRRYCATLSQWERERHL